MIHQGNCYTFDISKLLQEIHYEIDKQEISYNSTKLNVLEYIKDSTLFDRNNFTYSLYKINFINGVYDFEKDQFFDNSKPTPSEPPPYIPQENKPYPPVVLGKDYLFYEISHPFLTDIKYKCRNFKRALRQWLGPKNVVRPRDIFEMIGYCLTTSSKFKKAFLNYGNKDSGKSTFTNVLVKIIGRDNISSISLQRLNQRFGTNELQFKLLNLHPDLPKRKLFEVGIFKAATGDDLLIPAERKRGNQYAFRNSAKFWFNANEIPQVENMNDDAFFDRWILINFPNNFNHNSGIHDIDFAEKIADNWKERQGILHEAVKGLKRLISRGHFRKEIELNTRHVWNYYSNPLYAFIFDFCVKEPHQHIAVDDFYEKYNEYRLEKGLNGVKKQTLTPEMQMLGIPKKQFRVLKERTYGYSGIKWKEGINDEPEQITLLEKQFGIACKTRA